MIQVEVTKNLILQEDICFGIGSVEQTRGSETFTGTKVNTADMPYDATHTLGERINDLDVAYNYIMANVGTDPAVVPLSSLIRKSGNDLIDNTNAVFTPQVIDSASSLEASYPKKLWVKIIDATKHQLKRGADVLLEFNPVSHVPIFDYSAIAAAVTPLLRLGTSAIEDVGTSAGNVVQLDGSGKLPAVDGSELINLPIPTVTAIPIGGIIMWPSSVLPANFMECNGVAISRTAYAALFDIIGTGYGAGDGSTTFQLPEFRGEFIRGWDHGRGVDVGRALGSSQLDAFQGHQHAYSTGGNSAHITGALAANTGAHDPKTTGIFSDGTNGTPRVASETRPRNTSVMYIIRYQ